MRIAFISLMGGSLWGGSEALWHAAALYALQKGDSIFVSVYDWGTIHPKIKQLEDAGAIVFFRKKYNPSAGYLQKLMRFLFHRMPTSNKDYQAIFNFKPEAVFISQGDSFDLAIHHSPLYHLLLKNKIPFSFVCHSHAQYGFIPPHSIYPGAISIFKNAKNVFFVSNRQWHLTERRLIQKLKNAKFTWNPLGFPIGLAPLQWPAENAMQMAIVGNLDDMKGHDTVFEVLASDVWKSRYWHLNIYGNGQGINYLKDLAIYYNIFENITFQGYVNNIKEAWMNNHLLLIPSSGEGLPTSLIEAMVCGRPAVVTDVGGNVELVEENISGFIAASPTVSAFAEALEKAWKYRTGWQQMGKAAFETVTKIIDTDPHIKIYDLLKD